MGAFELAMTPVGAIVFNFQDLLFTDWVPIRRRIYFAREFSHRGYVVGCPIELWLSDFVSISDFRFPFCQLEWG